MKQDALIFLAIIAGMTVFWYFICLSLSRWDGWSTLVKVYPPVVGMRFNRKHRLRYLAMRWQTNLEMCVTLHLNDRGMLVTMTPIFRMWHPPFFVPWSEIQTEPPGHVKRGVFAYVQTVLKFNRAQDYPMKLKTEEWANVLSMVGKDGDAFMETNNTNR